MWADTETSWSSWITPYFMIYQNSLIPSAVMPYYKMSTVCLPESLDSDLDDCHSFNCFISVHIKQTHTSKQRHHVRTDICSQTHFMVAVYTMHVWNQAVKSSLPYLYHMCLFVYWHLCVHVSWCQWLMSVIHFLISIIRKENIITSYKFLPCTWAIQLPK